MVLWLNPFIPWSVCAGSTCPLVGQSVGLSFNWLVSLWSCPLIRSSVSWLVPQLAWPLTRLVGPSVGWPFDQLVPLLVGDRVDQSLSRWFVGVSVGPLTCSWSVLGQSVLQLVSFLVCHLISWSVSGSVPLVCWPFDLLIDPSVLCRGQLVIWLSGLLFCSLVGHSLAHQLVGPMVGQLIPWLVHPSIC